jgi:acetolactate synthase-1/2/3 large subunit
MSSTSAQTPTAAHHLLQGLTDLGVRYIFSNLGTDHVSLIEELARWDQTGLPHPQMVLCPHENVAVHMAAGYAAMTAQGQAVVVHVDAGTANASMGLHNMFRTRLPVLLMAGKTPFTLHGELAGSRDNYVHFVQDPFDMASLVRPYVKWEYSLPSGVVAKEVVRRAHSVMQSDPPGPVYLTLPREVLAEHCADTQTIPYNAQRFGAVGLGGIDEAQVLALAESLMKARSPMAVTAYLGRKAEAVAALEDLTLLCGIQVYEFSPTYLNMSRTHPCFMGFDPGQGLSSADLGLLLDVDVPWLPKFTRPQAETRWIHVDVDPIKKDFPMWGFATDHRIQADCAQVLGQVAQKVRELADPGFHQRVAERVASWGDVRDARRALLTQAAAQTGTTGAIAPSYFFAQLGAALRPDDVVVNEAIRNVPFLLNQVERTEALSLIGNAGGGLGYSGGMALGAKLALKSIKPKARVVQVVGDGGFHFSTPTSVYATAQAYELPIFTAVLDNGGWQAVREAVVRVYPEGEAVKSDQFQARLQGRKRQFEQVAQAFGGYGECVQEPAEVAAAIDRCLAAVDRGQAAVLNVQIGLQ